MSFLPAVQRQIAALPVNDPERIVLEFLSGRAVGRQNAVPLAAIVRHLRGHGIRMSEQQFQQGILARSRGSDYFIGSSHRGLFLIDTMQDAEEMRDFYEARIRREQENLDNLRRQARAFNWAI